MSTLTCGVQYELWFQRFVNSDADNISSTEYSTYLFNCEVRSNPPSPFSIYQHDNNQDLLINSQSSHWFTIMLMVRCFRHLCYAAYPQMFVGQ